MSSADELDIAGLRTFIVERTLAPPDCRIEARLLSGGKSNMTYFLRVDDTELVLRRPPLGEFDPRTHDVGREYRILSALATTTLPIPQVLAESTDNRFIGAPFYLMRRVHGWVLESVTTLPEDMRSPAALTSIMDTVVDGLVTLHAIDPATVGLANLGKPEGYARRQVQRWTRQWTERQKRSIPELDEAGRHLLRLAERLPLDAERPTIVHGDYNLGNMIIAPGSPPRLAAILDWEMATIGHPMMDLGALLIYQSPLMGYIFERTDPVASLPGFPTTDWIAKAYATRSGRSIELIDFFRALALFKILVLIEDIRDRYEAGTTRGEGYSTLGRSTPQNAAALLELIRESPLFA